MITNAAKDERKQREAILRRVYEDNVHLREPGYRASPRGRRRRPRARSVLTGLVLLLAAGAPSYEHVASQAQAVAVEGAPARNVDGVAAGLTAGTADRIVAAAVAPSAAIRPPGTNGFSAADLAAARNASADLPNGPMTVRDLFGLSVRTIVIDAGHGGRDPGTMGRRGTLEKDVTLDVARSLKAILERNPEFRIFLVRDGDAFVTLNERAAYANSRDADLFVSIHVNYVPGMSKNAVETYYFGQYQDLRARALAQRENQYSSYTISEFEKLASSMQNTMKLQESAALAAAIHGSLLRNMRRLNHVVLDTGVRSAPFVVLLGVKAPSVLVEIGNLSSVDAEQNLQNAEYREEIASYLASGITDYLNATNDGKTHHVKGKDGIAKQ